MSTYSSDPTTICSRHGLVCLDDLSHRGSTSDLVLRVQDVQGRAYVLKHVGSGLGESEVRALQAWQVSGVTPRLIKELEPGYDLIEWLEGRTMAEVSRDEPVPAVDIGQALAALHRVPPPDETPDIRSRFALAPEAGLRLLPPSLSGLADRLATRLQHHEGHQSVFLQGSLHTGRSSALPGCDSSPVGH